LSEHARGITGLATGNATVVQQITQRRLAHRALVERDSDGLGDVAGGDLADAGECAQPPLDALRAGGEVEPVQRNRDRLHAVPSFSGETIHVS